MVLPPSEVGDPCYQPGEGGASYGCEFTIDLQDGTGTTILVIYGVSIDDQGRCWTATPQDFGYDSPSSSSTELMPAGDYYHELSGCI